MEPTKYGRRNDVAAGVVLDSGRRCTRRALTDRPMGPPEVEIANILSQHMSQMASLKISTRSRHSALADLTQRSAMESARGDLKGVRICVMPRWLTRRSNVAP
jgi:hypothetical protein